jgi:hypothetical protein
VLASYLLFQIVGSHAVAPRLIIGAIHKELGKKMECLYTKDLRLNTVHADDVAKALHFLWYAPFF